MRDFSALDFKKLVDEFQSLVNGRVDKFFQPSKKELIITLHVTGKGKQIVRLVVPKFMCLTSSKPASEVNLGGFCVSLRKKLGGSFIRSIDLVDSERIVKFTFESKEGKYDLFLEFFDKGNIILCQDNKILGVAEQQRWRDRILKNREGYVFPKKDHDFFKLKKDDFCNVLEKSKNNIGKALAVDIGLGGLYSQELCKLTSTDKASNPKDADCNSLFKSFKELISKDLSPTIILKDGSVKDTTPFDLALYEGFENKKVASFSEAIDSVFKEEIPQTSQNKTVARIQKIVDAQTVQIKTMEKEIEENQKKGELIYENYAEVEDIIKTLKSVWGKTSLKEIKEKLKDHKKISEINKNGEVILEL